MLDEYKRHGFVFSGSLFSEADMADVDRVTTALIEGRPAGLAAEDLMNLHMTDQAIFDWCRKPQVLDFAASVLGTPDLSIFTSRILCKLPHVGKEIPWHQVRAIAA